MVKRSIIRNVYRRMISIYMHFDQTKYTRVLPENTFFWESRVIFSPPINVADRYGECTRCFGLGFLIALSVGQVTVRADTACMARIPVVHSIMYTATPARLILVARLVAPTRLALSHHLSASGQEADRFIIVGPWRRRAQLTEYTVSFTMLYRP